MMAITMQARVVLFLVDKLVATDKVTPMTALSLLSEVVTRNVVPSA